jgi:hypothetical protein
MHVGYIALSRGDQKVPTTIDTSQSIEVAASDMNALKAAAKKTLPWLSPARRLEMLARCYGYRSAAAFQAALKGATPEHPIILEALNGVPPMDLVDFAIELTSASHVPEDEVAERLAELLSLGRGVNQNISRGRTKRHDHRCGEMFVVAATTCVARDGRIYPRPEAVPASLNDHQAPMSIYFHDDDELVLWTSWSDYPGNDWGEMNWRKVGSDHLVSISSELAPYASRNSARWHVVVAEQGAKVSSSLGFGVFEVRQNQMEADGHLEWRINIDIPALVAAESAPRRGDRKMVDLLVQRAAYAVYDHLERSGYNAGAFSYHSEDRMPTLLQIKIGGSDLVAPDDLKSFEEALASQFDTMPSSSTWCAHDAIGPTLIDLFGSSATPRRWRLSPMPVLDFEEGFRESIDEERRVPSWADLSDHWSGLTDIAVDIDRITQGAYDDDALLETVQSLLDDGCALIKLTGSLHVFGPNARDIEAVLRVSMVDDVASARPWSIGAFGPPGKIFEIGDCAINALVRRLGIPYVFGDDATFSVHSPDRMEPIIVLRPTSAYSALLSTLNADQDLMLRSRIM